MQSVHSADGTRIAFELSGAGPSLVLVGGAFQDRSSMGTLARRLRDRFTVLQYDRRGRGDSGDTPPYAVAREVEDLAAVIEAAGEPAFVFGQSSGGALALEAASQGVAIRALVVHEPPFTPGPTTALADRLDQLVADGELGEATAAFVALTGTPAAAIAEMRSSPGWPRMEVCAPTLSHDVRLCNDGVVPAERLNNVRVPTLALAGGNSPRWAHRAVIAIAAVVPGGRFEVLDGQSHNVTDEVLAGVLGRFLVPSAPPTRSSARPTRSSSPPFAQGGRSPSVESDPPVE